MRTPTNRSYSERAGYLKEVIAKTRSLDLAGDVVEGALREASTREIATPPTAADRAVEATHGE